MTLDEAIKHAEEVADKKEREKQKWEKWLETDSDSRAVTEKVSCELCAEEHRQLAEWLTDYKRLLEQEPGDVISRAGAELLFRNARSKLNPADYKTADEFNTRDLMLLNAEQLIHLLPSVKLQDPKTGHWIEGRTYMECSNCHDIWFYEVNQTERFKFCPTCGAKMIEPLKSEE